MSEARFGGAVPRTLHPGAWWAWAGCLATVAAWTTNPLLLGLVIGVAAVVATARREDAPWARSFGLYLRVGLLVIAIRVVLRAVLAGGTGGLVLFTLPALPLPDWMAGIRIGGAVTAEALAAAFVDGLRLATILVCFGAANSLANPRRLLRALPNALSEAGAAVTVALSVAPQLAESLFRVRRAQRLRGGGRIGVRRAALPVLADALDRSIALAAAMDARGYGRASDVSLRQRRATTAVMVGGLLGMCAGMYALLDGSAPPGVVLGGLVAGGSLLAAGIALAGRWTRRTRHRPDRWLGAEWMVLATGIGCVALVSVGARLDPASMVAAISPLAWPQLPALPAAGILLASLPAMLAPMPPLRAMAAAEGRAAPASAPLEAGW